MQDEVADVEDVEVEDPRKCGMEEPLTMLYRERRETRLRATSPTLPELPKLLTRSSYK